MKDFTPTEETITLHGLGFIQFQLNPTQRIHVWHPDLPRRICFVDSAVHNHRFGFRSQILVGVQRNQRVKVEIVKPGTGAYDLISHNGPRLPSGSRDSYPVAECNIHPGTVEIYHPGEEYTIIPHEYHHTPCEGKVVTLLTKTYEDTIHANSVIRKGVKFDTGFDRFQLTPVQLFEYVKDAMLEGMRNPQPVLADYRELSVA